MAQVFSAEVPIRFSNCDPAGIVYFPEFFDLINSLVEDWFTIGMDTSYADLMMRRHIGTRISDEDVATEAPLRRSSPAGPQEMNDEVFGYFFERFSHSV